MVLAALALVALLRIAHGYSVFNNTFDEPLHLGAAMQYVDDGRYDYEFHHPPMRAVFAIGPRLLGKRFGNSPTMEQEGHRLLYGGGDYLTTLTAARVASLPFFLLALLVVFLWARDLAGPRAGALAALAYSTLPLALAHAGLATTDTLVTGTFTAALYAWARLLTRPSRGRALLFGVLAALAIVSKFSALFFLLPIVAVTGLPWVLGLRGFAGRSTERSTRRRPASAGMALLAASAAGAFVIWAAYRFSFGSIGDLGRGEELLARAASGQTPSLVSWLVTIPLPAPEFLLGIRDVLLHNSAGHPSYFAGRVTQHGHPAFFPVALLIKTPVPFLVLAGLGSFALLRQGWRRDSPAAMLPPLAAALVLLVCIASSIAIGLRHLLPIFPPLAVAAGVAALRLWQRRGSYRSLSRPLVVVLLGWQVAGGARAHPDYLAYFNECCSAAPQRWLVDSDLDWGQDLDRLSRALRDRRVDRLYLAYSGTADPYRHHLPPFAQLPPHHPVRGWVAISEWEFVTGTSAPPYDRYTWLRSHQPVARVGKSIRLYRIE